MRLVVELQGDEGYLQNWLSALNHHAQAGQWDMITIDTRTQTKDPAPKHWAFVKLDRPPESPLSDAELRKLRRLINEPTQGQS